MLMLCAGTEVLSQTAPASAPLSMPVPTKAPADSVETRPVYSPSTTSAPSVPSGAQEQKVDVEATTPKAAPQPVAPPAPATNEVPYRGYMPYGPAEGKKDFDRFSGSVYIPVDSWVYPALMRLYGMGYLDTMFLGVRPYTRRSVLHMLQGSENAIVTGDNEEAQEILAKLLTELSAEVPDGSRPRGAVYGVESSYTRVMGIDGPVLRDSYNIGQTLSNDYGRPYQPGFNALTGASTTNEWGPFSLYVRGEYQHAPAGPGYSYDLASLLSTIDTIIPYAAPNRPQATIPEGPIVAQNPFRLVEATLSAHVWGHEISGGKSDAWLGPGMGGSGDWSNNAENIYSFRINRVEPWKIPLVWRVLGPLRYDFFYGSLKGHTAPNDDWVHSEIFSFLPTNNFEFAFQRSIIFGGKGHEPVTLHTFLKGFFDPNDTTGALKYSRDDPGARFAAFTFSYRLPFVRRYATMYADSFDHDDVTPISAPRRAAYRTGIYLSRIPRLNKFDFRLEAVSTDPNVTRSSKGTFYYFEVVQQQGYTNKGMIMGDWIGREAKGGQAWLTYHLSGNEWVQLEYLNKKTESNFIPGGTTQNQFKAGVVKRLGRDVELNGWVQYEGWKAPVPVNGVNLLRTGLQRDTTTAVQLTWFPKLHSYPSLGQR